MAFAQKLTPAACTQLLVPPQALKQLESKQQAIVEKAAGAVCSSVTGPVGSDSRPPLVTRHAPNQQQSFLDQQQQPALQQQPSRVCAIPIGKAFWRGALQQPGLCTACCALNCGSFTKGSRCHNPV